MNDPETAEYLANLRMEQDESEREPYAPRLSEWDIHATLMREMVDGIKSLRATMIGLKGGKPGEVKPFPTPKTAFEEAMKEAERRWSKDFGAQFGFSPEDF